MAGESLVALTDQKAVKVAEAEGIKPALAKIFYMQNRNGEIFIKKAGLLHKLENKFGPMGYSIQVLVPTVEEYNLMREMMGHATDERCAIVKAVLTTKEGQVFEDYGTATTGNTNQKTGQHLIEMASTRAQNRAVRSATVCGFTSYEELRDASLDDELPQKIVVEDADIEPVPGLTDMDERLTDEEAKRFADEVFERLKCAPWHVMNHLKKHYGLTTMAQMTTEMANEVWKLANKGHFKEVTKQDGKPENPA